MQVKDFLKEILITLRLDVTQNIKYDRLTRNIINQVVQPESNCIDIGCHKGEILELIIRCAPEGKHFAFEPIPYLYQQLEKKFPRQVKIYPYALAEKNGKSTFHLVKNAPAYSGLKQRKYDIENPEIEKIEVEIKTLDEVIPNDITIDFIKIDVEGAEYGVLKGAQRILQNKPVILFEFGKGASDFYGTQPKDVFRLLQQYDLHIYTLPAFLNNAAALTLPEFENLYESNAEYYFVAG